jgi:hypothetical protein
VRQDTHKDVQTHDVLMPRMICKNAPIDSSR